VKREVSDIHFEPEANFLRIRYRIDGMLRQIRALHKSYWPAMTVRIKVLSGMNIAEMRAPQDGRIGLTVSGRQVDFRVACQPTIHGENIVLRVLDRQKGIVPLEDLGLADEHLQRLKLMIARPEGIILVTGPTGSGKTTTLYSVLNHINTEGIHIMTLEDPVEYPMALVRQTSVAETSKLDFANGIRSMMRQDPDVILVGEIRDADTAEMAFRAAMTGHQVYSTLHTNSAVGTIPRLLDIGVLPDIMAGNIIGIVAQRLVRKLCRLRRLEIVVHTTHRRTQPTCGEVARLTLDAQYEIRHRRRGHRSESVHPYLALNHHRQQLLTATLVTRTSSGTAGRGSGSAQTPARRSRTGGVGRRRQGQRYQSRLSAKDLVLAEISDDRADR